MEPAMEFLHTVFPPGTRCKHATPPTWQQFTGGCGGKTGQGPLAGFTNLATTHSVAVGESHKTVTEGNRRPSGRYSAGERPLSPQRARAVRVSTCRRDRHEGWGKATLIQPDMVSRPSSLQKCQRHPRPSLMVGLRVG